MADPIKPFRNALRRIRRERPIPIGTRIALERELAGLSASHCARAMEWSHTTWQNMESGERALTLAERQKIAGVLGVTDNRLTGDQPYAVAGYKRRGRPPSSPRSTSRAHGEHALA